MPSFSLSEEERAKKRATAAGDKDHLNLIGPIDEDINGNVELLVSRDDYLD